MPFRLGPLELIIVLAIIMVVFGVGKLPQIGGAMGKGIRNFRKGVSEEDEAATTDAQELDGTRPSTAPKG